VRDPLELRALAVLEVEERQVERDERRIEVEVFVEIEVSGSQEESFGLLDLSPSPWR
jgi:hypothetical protein